MNCPTCRTEFRVRSGDEGNARNVCACEKKAQKCAFKKRGRECAPLAQAVVDPYDSSEVVHYRCGNHAIVELLDDEPEPTPAPKVELPPEPADPESRVGMIIVEHDYVALKKAAEADLKTYKHSVVCLDCKDHHKYSTRKLVGEGKSWRIICPKCSGNPYQIID